jgi:hypothetical protein
VQIATIKVIIVSVCFRNVLLRLSTNYYGDDPSRSSTPGQRLPGEGGGHTHSVSLTQSQLQSIESGGTVSVNSCTASRSRRHSSTAGVGVQVGLTESDGCFVRTSSAQSSACAS